MSDIEEPPSKVLKLETSGVEEHLDPEGDEDMGEGQEEWLSEGVLTDDDFNTGSQGDGEAMGPMEMLDDSRTADDDATPSLDDSNERLDKIGQLDPTDSQQWLEHNGNAQDGVKDKVSDKGEVEQTTKVVEKAQEGQAEEKAKKEEQDIEDTLNDLDRRNELPEDLDAFLIRKSDGHVVDKETKTENQPTAAPADDDGNDTDDLLRMLGEDDSKVKKKVLVKKCSTNKDDMLSSDDEFTYENAKVKTLKVAKSVLMKKRPATKAVPEVVTDEFTDASSDEANTMKKMFAVTPKKTVAAKSTAKIPAQAKPHEKLVSTNIKPQPIAKPAPAHSTPIKQHMDKNLQPKPIHNPARPVLPSGPQPRPGTNAPETKPTPVKPEPAVKIESKPKMEDKPSVKQPRVDTNKHMKMEVGDESHADEMLDEIIDDEEFLEEEGEFDLDEEEFGEESDLEEGKQRIMRPERMDEEGISDGDTHTEDGSLYDEMPSSDSEDLDDWFSLDVRAERAGDYLPLLGSKARSLLLEEKRRVSARLSTLRHSLSALTDSGRRQAEQLRRATMTLAELDDMLKAT